MKKRLLLFAAVLTASANFMFAEEKTVQDSNGNTFSYDTKTDLDPSSYEGETTYSQLPSITISADSYQLILNSDQITRISNRNFIYNVKLANVSNTPGTIASFTQNFTSTTTNHDIAVKPDDFVTIVRKGRKIQAYLLDEGNEAYAKYVLACERAMAIRPDLVCKGSDLIAGNIYDEVIDVDDDGVDVISSLYYMLARNGATIVPILETTGVYATGTTYSNSSITYNPVGIAEGYQSYTVKGEGKVGYVHGVVNNGQVKEILANDDYKYLNFDFTEASILGSVATDIDDNRIAYFARNTDAIGQNIVVGSTCESYVISDNAQEIFVNKSFAAEVSQYKRTFSPDSYGTIVLPFTVTGTGNIFVKQAKLTGYVPGPDNESSITNKLTFTSTEAIAANTPYLYKTLGTVSGESIFFGDTNGTVKATEEAKSANFNGAQFVGTFEGLSAEEASNVYVVGMVGGVGKIGKTKKALKPGRCYFTYESTNNAKAMENVTIEIIDEDGSVETVDVDKTVTAIDGVVNGEIVSVQYISANGQISNEPFSGINLVKKTFEDGSVETSKVIF
ncbi:MAG: hypothetical protein IJL70_10015 [Treponema sp.]|nr:hypothetical protein [Treponema sp.]